MNLKKLMNRKLYGSRISDKRLEGRLMLFDNNFNTRFFKGTYNGDRLLKYKFEVTERETIYSSGEITDAKIDKVPKEKNGGVITFSTDVNALDLSKNAFVNKVKQVFKSLSNRINRGRIITEVVSKYNFCWSIGNYFKGRYVDENGVFDEKSMSVQIIGIGTRELLDCADELRKAFIQKSVMVLDYFNNEVFFVDIDEDEKKEWNEQLEKKSQRGKSLEEKL